MNDVRVCVCVRNLLYSERSGPDDRVEVVKREGNDLMRQLNWCKRIIFYRIVLIRKRLNRV